MGFRAMAQERCESLAESALLEISTGRVLRLIASSWPADTEIQGSISAEDHLSDVLPLWQTRSTPHWPACVGDHERVCAPRERRPVVLRTGLTRLEIAAMPFPAFWARVQAMRNWAPGVAITIRQVHERAASTVAAPHGMGATCGTPADRRPRRRAGAAARRRQRGDSRAARGH
jgi:hypothetical protein